MKTAHFEAIAASLAIVVVAVAIPNSARSQSEVKFRLLHDSSIILVPVLVNGQGPFEFILDTGADDVVVDKSLAKRLGLVSSGRAHQATIAGAWAPDQSEAESLQVGSARTEKTLILLTDLSPLCALAAGAQGVLGQGFLSHFNYLLDYEHRSIRFEQADEIQDSIHGEPIPTTLAGRRMIVYAQVQVKGSVAVRLLLDSGANTLVLSRASSDAARIVLDTPRLETTVSTRVALPSGRVPQLTVGLWRLRDLPAAVTSAQLMPQICDGLLPASIFKSIYVNNTQGFVEIPNSARQIHEFARDRRVSH
jgi:predicted aspartyl protease